MSPPPPPPRRRLLSTSHPLVATDRAYLDCRCSPLLAGACWTGRPRSATRWNGDYPAPTIPLNTSHAPYPPAPSNPPAPAQSDVREPGAPAHGGAVRDRPHGPERREEHPGRAAQRAQGAPCRALPDPHPIPLKDVPRPSPSLIPTIKDATHRTPVLHSIRSASHP